ncbi:MAG: PEP/pyruvate-binding domain-containing protein [Elusimicrobiales bacterium]|nr:PEP/pyruvate-binding domain-containing protein [Elusimicrobiales bacterium]
MNTGTEFFCQLGQASDPELYGRKAFNLALLARSGFRVPRGFVIPAGTRPEKLDRELAAAFTQLGSPLAAVRSSAASEDGVKTSFAGQFDSFLGVGAAGLRQAVNACLTSASSARAAAYGGGAAVRMAVIVQELVDADVSGVAFSCDPVTGDRNSVVVEAIYGLCEPLVSGAVTPDHYTLTGLEVKETLPAPQRELLAADPAGGTLTRPVPEALRSAPKLNAEALRQVGAAAIRAELLFGAPMDIEWALKDGKLYLLQARPVTGLGD